MKVACVEDKNVVIKEKENINLADFGGIGAIVKVKGCGLCGSDIVKLRDNLAKNGTVLGHEIVAQIVEINSKTDFKTGDPATVHLPHFALHTKKEHLQVGFDDASALEDLTFEYVGGDDESFYIKASYMLDFKMVNPYEFKAAL